MAKGRRGRVRRQGEDVPEDLLRAFRWDFLLGGQAQKYPEKVRRRWWRSHREEILRYSVEVKESRFNDGWRPRLFWKDLHRGGHRRKRVGFESGVGMSEKTGQPKMERWAVYEDDYAYLKRLNLLTAAEKRIKHPNARPKEKFEI